MAAATGYLIWRLSTKWRTTVDRVVAPLGLTHAQFSLLGALSGLARSDRRPSQRELADHTGMAAIYVSKLARALERAGLVERPADRDDPRAVRLTLTSRGHEVVRQAVRLVDALQVDQLGPIGGVDSDRHREFRETLLALLDEKPLSRNESARPMTATSPFSAADLGVAAAATRAVLDRLLAQADLSFEEWAALAATVTNDVAPEARPRVDVAFPALSMPRIAVSVQLRQLEAAGLVRATGDRIGTTSEGRELFERINAASRRAGEQLVEGLPEADLEAAKRVLDSISERAEEVLVEL
ncbi:MAG TPA: MarR family transcriptional regulator [Amycolatopsis sp.]|nr:MarR family transcriptional regulator [Amycolatopsis sp.]